MSGPIVRTGTTPAFWKNWERVFGGKQASGGKKKSTEKASVAKKPAAKAKKKK